MLNWNSLTWVDHSNSRRVNNCRVLMKFTMREARAGHGPGLHCQSRRESRQISGVQAGHMMMIVLSLVWGGVHTTPVLTSESASVGRDNRWERESDIRADPGHDIWSLVSRGRSEILIPLQGRSHTIVICIQALIWDTRRAGAWKCIGEGVFTWILQCELTLKWVWTQRITAPPMANFAVPRHWRESPGPGLLGTE